MRSLTVTLALLMSLLSSRIVDAGENVTLAAFGQANSPQINLAAVAEPGSPVVGSTVQVTNDLHFTVGYRLWLNYWQTSVAKVPLSIVDPDNDAGCPNGQCPITQQGDGPTINQFAAASIPSVGVRYKDFFASASVMISPDYHFPTASELVSSSDPNGFFLHEFRINHHITGSRNEVDVNLGYYVHPWIALTMGYKGVFQKFKDKASTFDVSSNQPGDTITQKSKPQYNGGTLGVAANVPIPEAGWIPAGFSLYGNGGGGVMGSNDFRVAFYGTIDAGLAYKPTQLPLLFTTGFKLQIINSLTHSDATQNHIIDYTRGMILGMHFVF